MKMHLGGISMKLSNSEHCENTKTRWFLPLIEPPDIDGASLIRTLEQPQRNDALSAQPSLAFLIRVDFVCSRSESRQRAHFVQCSTVHEWRLSLLRPRFLRYRALPRLSSRLNDE
jgi:hypothetical protein